MDRTGVFERVKTLKPIDKRSLHDLEKQPKVIYSSLVEGQRSPSQLNVSPATSVSSLDSGFIHGCSTPPPSPEEELINNTNDDRKNNQSIYEVTSTPVLTRASILRTSSQRFNSLNFSNNSNVSRDSVQFELSVPKESNDIYSDSDSDSNSGYYTINTNIQKEKPKRKRVLKDDEQSTDWKPIVHTLKDTKHSIRYQIKPGYVSQIKKIFSSKDDIHAADQDITPWKSQLKRHKSVNDVSNRYLSILKNRTETIQPQRTHSLSKIDDRRDFKVVKNVYIDTENESAPSKASQNLHRKPSRHTVRLDNKFADSGHISKDTYINKHVNERYSGTKNEPSENVQNGYSESSSSLQRSHSQRNLNNNKNTTNKVVTRSSSMKTTGLKDFLQKQYPSGSNSLSDLREENLVKDETERVTFPEEKRKRTNVSLSTQEEWKVKPRQIQLEERSSPCNKQNDNLNIEESVKPYQNFDNNLNENRQSRDHLINEQGTRKVKASPERQIDPSVNVKRLENHAMQKSADALKSFLRKRYPPQEELLKNEQQETRSFAHIKTDCNDRSEIERLVFKFGLGNKSSSDWESKINQHKSVPDQHDSYLARQIDPTHVECPSPILDSPSTADDKEHEKRLQEAFNDPQTQIHLESPPLWDKVEGHLSTNKNLSQSDQNGDIHLEKKTDIHIGHLEKEPQKIKYSDYSSTDLKVVFENDDLPLTPPPDFKDDHGTESQKQFDTKVSYLKVNIHSPRKTEWYSFHEKTTDAFLNESENILESPPVESELLKSPNSISVIKTGCNDTNYSTSNNSHDIDNSSSSSDTSFNVSSKSQSIKPDRISPTFTNTHSEDINSINVEESDSHENKLSINHMSQTYTTDTVEYETPKKTPPKKPPRKKKSNSCVDLMQSVVATDEVTNDITSPFTELHKPDNGSKNLPLNETTELCDGADIEAVNVTACFDVVESQTTPLTTCINTNVLQEIGSNCENKIPNFYHNAHEHGNIFVEINTTNGNSEGECATCIPSETNILKPEASFTYYDMSEDKTNDNAKSINDKQNENTPDCDQNQPLIGNILSEDSDSFDRTLKDTEQQLCQTYLDLMDTWLAKRASAKVGDDDWENVKSKLNMGTILDDQEQNDISSTYSDSRADSSEEGEYVVETSFADEYGNLACLDEETSIKKTFEFPQYDENGDEIKREIPPNEIEIENVSNSSETDRFYKENFETERKSGDINETTDMEDLKSSLKLNLSFLEETENDEINDYAQDFYPEDTNKIDLYVESNNVSKINKHSEDDNNTKAEYKPKRSVTFDVNVTDDSEVIHACHTQGSECNDVDHVIQGKPLTPVFPHQTNKDGVFSTDADVHVEDLKSSTNSNSDKDSNIAIIQEVSASAMPEKSSGKTKTSQMSEYRGGKKITTKTSTSVNNNEYGDDQTEQKRHLNHLSETIAKLTGENNEDIIPEINQTITKLNGGNLVITTLTHRIVEEEDEDKQMSALVPTESSSNKNAYIVQDHKGDTYMIEDITDDTHESAYYSSSDHRYNSEYESLSSGSGSPQYHKIHNLQAHGHSGVDYNTAEEVILSLYNPNSMEYTEIDERNYSGQYTNDSTRQGQGQILPYGYSDSTSNKQTTSYEYEDGGPPRHQPYGSSSVKTVKQSYEMSSGGPYVTDGKSGYIDSQDVNMRKEVTNQASTYDTSGINSMSAAYMVEANSSLPQINPYFVQQPLVLPQIPQLPVPQFNLLQVEPLPQKVTTGVQVRTEPVKQITQKKEEHKIVTSVDETDSKRIQERPVYKSVALVKGPYESPKWHTAKKHKQFEPEDEVDSGRRYKVVSSSASDDVKEETMEYSESTKTYTTMKTENMEITGGIDMNRNANSLNFGRTGYPVTINGSGEFIEPRYVTEKTITIGKQPNADARQFRSTIEVNNNRFGGNRQKPYDQLDGYQSKLSSMLNHQQQYQETPEPERKQYTDVDRDIRVVRGNILIKNNFDEGLDEYNDNINVFDNGFSMSKQNPLYNSDEDMYKRFEEDKKRQQERDMRDMENMAFETVDRFKKTKNVTRKADGERKRPPRSKQNLTNLLLSRLSTMDSKDIRQTIDVKHHHEDVFGDPQLSRPDGVSSGRITNSNFDTVSENVDLTMRDGKAFITITVTAERLTPVDYEFHVWRKNQAIVTRVVEIDFYADEQRRVLYDRVMDRVDDEGFSENKRYSHYTRRKPQEVVLSSQDTLDLFHELMDATGGEGDTEDITVKTRRNKTVLPENPFLY